MMRYGNGARGTLWASQVATGCENALTLRVYGTKAQLLFRQESPNELWFTPQGGEPRKLTRGRASGAGQAVRIPAGPDRQRVVEGKRVAGRVDLGGRRIIKNKKQSTIHV